MVKAFEIPRSGADAPAPAPGARDNGSSVSFGPFRFDPANGLLYDGGREIPLPPRALGVLALLVERRGHVVSKQELLDTVWRDVAVEEASLKEAISTLRQALGDDPKQPRYIRTVHRRGYRFVAATTVEPDAAHPSPAGTFRWSVPALLLAGLLLGGLAATWWHATHVPRGRAPVRFAVTPPGGDELAGTESPAVAIAPDGNTFAFVARHGEIDRLYLRTLDSPEPRVVAGSEHAQTPFFSPDGSWIGFCAGGTLAITPVAGGAVTALAHTRDCEGANWGPGDAIVYGSDTGLWSVPARGGAAQPLTHIDPAKGEIGHWWPRVLPDGSMLFTVWRTALDDSEIALLRPGETRYEVVFTGGSDAHYLPDGRLLIARGGGAVTLPFDTATGSVTGPPVATGTRVLVSSFMGFAQLAVAANGTRVLMSGAPAAAAHVGWLDENGAVTDTGLPVRDYRNAALSADARHVAVTINAADHYDVWIGDLARGSLTRLTSAGRNTEPVWSPEGERVACAHSGDGPFAIVRRRADGGGEPEALATGDEPVYPMDFSADGRLLAFGRMSAGGGEDIWITDLTGARESRPFLETPANESDARFSPDGRWIAYTTDASGRSPGDYQIFLRTFPDTGRAWPVSVGSGQEPVWAADGRAIYYQDRGRILKVPLDTSSDEPVIGTPAELARADHMLLRGVAPEDDRLLVLRNDDPGRAPRRLLVDVRG